MTSGLSALVACVALSACAAPRVPRSAGAPAAAPLDTAEIPRLIQLGAADTNANSDIEYLTDVIGPRLTGGAGLARAVDWAQEKFRDYGLENVHVEPWTFGVGWTRGPMTARLLAPQRRELLAASWAWSPGTNGPRAGNVVYVDARTRRDYERRFAGKLHGAWVMLGPPAVLPNPDAPPATHADSVRLDSAARAIRPANDDEREFAAMRLSLVAREHIAGVLRDGGKPFGLLSMSGSPAAVSPDPQIVISHDDYTQLARLAESGIVPRLEADVSNAFSRDTLQADNVVAEVRGAELPDEVVLLGAHLDSWDLSTGGTDNGAGAIAVLEAARLLRAAGARPRRTIRFVLFTGEEEGLFGSQAYAAAHRAELDRMQAVLVLDNGTGRITGVGLQRHDELRALWTSMFEPLAASPGIGPLEARAEYKTGTDHLSFLPYGVPSFNYDQRSRGYDHTHHSQIDDYDHVLPADIEQAAVVMAANAWQLAQLPNRLGRW